MIKTTEIVGKKMRDWYCSKLCNSSEIPCRVVPWTYERNVNIIVILVYRQMIY